MRNLLIIFLLIFVPLAFIGCLDKASDSEMSNLDNYFPDDSELPGRPAWVNVQPEVLFSRDSEDGVQQNIFGVFLEWTKVTTNFKGDAKANIIGYKIYRDNQQQAVALILGSDVTTYEDFDRTALLDDTKHTYYVSAIDSRMRETFSDAQFVEFKVKSEYPEAPRKFFILGDGNHVSLYWDVPENAQYCLDNGDEISGYRIQRKHESDQWKTLALVPADRRKFVDGNIIFGHLYQYQIQAVTDSGTVGTASEIRGFQLREVYNEDLSMPTAPDKLRLERAETGKQGNIRLIWQAPLWNDDGKDGKNMASDTVAYKIWRFETVDFNPELAQKSKYTLIDVIYNQQEYIDYDVDVTRTDKFFYYRVSAVDTMDHEGDLSYPVCWNRKINAATKATPQPVEFAYEIDQEKKVIFKWRYDDGVEFYQFMTSTNGRIFNEERIIDARKELTAYNHGDMVYYRVGGLTLLDGEVLYMKLRAYDNAYDFYSNPTYYLRIMKSGKFQDNRLVLYPADLAGLFEARSIQQAWLAERMMGATQVARDSLWDYDIIRGTHYRIEAVEVSGNKILILDTMGNQPPPAQTAAQVFSGIPITLEISTDDYIYADLSSTISSEVGTVDSVRPMLYASPRMSALDTRESYYYLSSYNDDGLTYWSDYGADNITYGDFLYMHEDYQMLQHGMEGDVVKLNHDVDPWTYYGSAISFNQLKVGKSGYAEFWDTVSSYNGGAPYDRTSRNLLNDWDTVKNQGGCSYMLGPHSGRRYIVRDFLGDWVSAGNRVEIHWAGNYFGPWYSAAWPASSEIVLADKNSAASVTVNGNLLVRPVRKDNTLAWDVSTGNVIDYNATGWSQSTRSNNYDLYQEEFRFRYNTPESGSYQVTMFFVPVMTLTGRYLVSLRVNGVLYGDPQIVSDISNKDTLRWGSVFCGESDILEFSFKALGTESAGLVTDLYGGSFNFMGANSPCQLFISRMEFLKK